jgi:hypothetical protein
VSTCTGADCSSVQIGGTVTNPSNNNHPWVIKTFATASGVHHTGSAVNPRA